MKIQFLVPVIINSKCPLVRNNFHKINFRFYQQKKFNSTINCLI